MASSTQPRVQTLERPRDAPVIPGHWLLGNARDLVSRGPEFLASLRTYGDVVRFRLLAFPVYMVTTPDGVRHVLHEHYRNYDREVIDYRMLSRVLGHGLLTSDGDSWLRQRRLAQPAFHRQRLATLGAMMATTTQQMLDRWERLPADQPIDMSAEMMRLTLRIVGFALFSTDTDREAQDIASALDVAQRKMSSYFFQPFPPMSVPSRRRHALDVATRQMEAVVYHIIAERRRNPGDRGDLLSMLMEARDAETGEAMTDQQLRDEVLTLLLAGHDTTANTLTWLWYLLSQHPSVEERLHAELASVLAGSSPSVERLADLPYAKMAIDETLRLYPVAWAFSRRAIAEDTIAGYRIPRHATIYISPYAAHHDPAYYPEPARFDPERFTPERVDARPRYAYFPFGGGPHQCIGNAFALMEAQIVLATVAQRFQPLLLPGQEVRPQGLVTLRPQHGMPMRLEHRH